MASQITATLPTLDFPREVDYPTQEDWADFSAAAELNFGILGNGWSTQMQLWKTQANAMSIELNTNADIAQGLANYQGDWTSQGYTLGQTVSVSEIYYICKLTHATGQNPTDVGSIYWNLAIGNWNLKVNTDMSGYASKTTPIDADLIPLSDSSSTFGIKKLSWANIKATLKTYFDTLYKVASSETTSGIIELATTEEAQAGTDDARAITPLKLKSTLDSRLLVRGTAVATTSGTAIDFTGIPSWAKRITVLFNQVGINNTDKILLRVGSGSIVTTGYTSACSALYSAGDGIGNGIATNTTGFMFDTNDGAFALSGSVEIFNLSGNLYVSNGSIGSVSGSATPMNQLQTGTITLSGALDRIRLTTVSGTAVFDSGSINIMYEG